MRLLYPRKRFDVSLVQLILMWSRALLSVRTNRYNEKLSQLWLAPNRCLSVYSVRSGWDLFLQAQAYPAGSVVIMSAVSIVDMARICEAQGLRVVTIDIDRQTLSPDIAELQRLLDEHRGNVACILYAHVFGAQALLKPAIELTKSYGVPFVEDCAQVFDGFRYEGHPSSDIELWSFGPVKTATAFAGSIVIAHPSQRQIFQKMKGLQQTYPVLPRLQYLRRLWHFSVLYILSTPLVFTVLMQILTQLGRDYDRLIAGSTRSFATGALLEQLRYRPNAGLLSCMYYRMSTFHQSDIFRREEAGKYIVANTTRESRVASRTLGHTHWLNPVYVPNAGILVETLRGQGIDASYVSTGLTVVRQPERTLGSSGLASHMDHILYIPCYPTMPKSEQGRIASVLSVSLRNTSKVATPVRQLSYAALQQSSHLMLHKPKTTTELVEVVTSAAAQNMEIVIIGANNSHGGHTVAGLDWVIDTKALDGILAYHAKAHTITVQAGASTAEVQQYLLRRGRSLLVTQSGTGFTIGGSIASNIHGRSLWHTSLRCAVVGMVVVDKKGNLHTLTPECKDFDAVIGGLGIGYIIAEATLLTAANTLFLEESTDGLTSDVVTKARTALTKDSEKYLWIRLIPDTQWNYTKYFMTVWRDSGRVSKNDSVHGSSRAMHYVYKLCTAGLYHGAPWFSAVVFGYESIRARHRSGKNQYSRAQLSMPPIVDNSHIPQSHKRWFNHVQEYFVPLEHIELFLDDLSGLQRKYDLKTITVTLRYVKQSNDGNLPQTPQADCFGVMLYMHTHRQAAAMQHVKQFLRDVTAVALHHDGRPYLTYAWAQTADQLCQAYPNLLRHIDEQQRNGPSSSYFAQRVKDQSLYVQE